MVPDVRIVIAGDGEDMAPYRALMAHPERFDVRDRWIPDDERDALFAAARVVALPYVEASQSGVVPVAHAHGRAVVASAVGGLPEAVDEDETGLLVPPADPQALAQALARTLSEPGLAERLGATGRARLVERARSEAVGARTAAVYGRALDERNRRRT
jgi:starch synthase